MDVGRTTTKTSLHPPPFPSHLPSTKEKIKHRNIIKNEEIKRVQKSPTPPPSLPLLSSPQRAPHGPKLDVSQHHCPIYMLKRAKPLATLMPKTETTVAEKALS